MDKPEKYKSLPNFPDEWKKWEGTFDQLVAASGQVIANLAPNVASPTGSLIRYYQQRGMVDRGNTQGRSSMFSAKELEQVVNTKLMADQSIPLSLVKSARSASTNNNAQDVVAGLMRNAGIYPQGATSLSSNTPTLNSFMSVTPLDFGGNPAISEVAQNSVDLTRNLIGGSLFESSPLRNSGYATLPKGGVARYELKAGATVELATTGDTQMQAQALREFADQLDAGINQNLPTL